PLSPSLSISICCDGQEKGTFNRIKTNSISLCPVHTCTQGQTDRDTRSQLRVGNHTDTHTDRQTDTHRQTDRQTQTLSVERGETHTPTHTHTLAHVRVRRHTHTHTLSVESGESHTHTHTHICFLSSNPLIFCLSLSYTLSLSLLWRLCSVSRHLVAHFSSAR